MVNIPANVAELPLDGGNPKSPRLPSGALQTRTDFGALGYGGPCPPQGDHHGAVQALTRAATSTLARCGELSRTTLIESHKSESPDSTTTSVAMDPGLSTPGVFAIGQIRQRRCTSYEESRLTTSDGDATASDASATFAPGPA